MSQVFSVAKEFVNLALSGDEPDPLTNLRLQKLLYYAQAWSLVVRERELFSDDLEAWRLGPVVPAVYLALPNCQGANQIHPEALAGTPDLQGDEAEFVRHVWEAYNPYSALQLAKMTHEEAPWANVWGHRPKNGTENEPISVIELEDFFGKQNMPAPIAAYAHELRKREQAAEQELATLAPLDAGRLMAAAKCFTPSTNLPTGGR
jgi:uncharacterized phage-associated protein